MLLRLVLWHQYDVEWSGQLLASIYHHHVYLHMTFVVCVPDLTHHSPTPLLVYISDQTKNSFISEEWRPFPISPIFTPTTSADSSRSSSSSSVLPRSFITPRSLNAKLSSSSHPSLRYNQTSTLFDIVCAASLKKVISHTSMSLGLKSLKNTKS